MEFILLCALPVVITTQMPALQSDETTISTVVVTVLSVFVLIPLPLMMFYVSKVMLRGYNGWSAATETSTAEALENGRKRQVGGHSTSEVTEVCDDEEAGDGKQTVW